jgi:hypothetical protein
MAKSELNPTLTRGNGACQVVVVYEDTSCRTGAMLVCNRLVQEFWTEIEFKFSWWRFDYLRDSLLAASAARAACKADLILVSAHSNRPFPGPLVQWIESWTSRRTGNGALMGLFWANNGQADAASPKQIYLRQIARRAGMEFLPTLPRHLPMLALSRPFQNGSPDSPMFVDDYLTRPPAPEGGIND